MDTRRRSVYVSPKQKKRLLQLMVKHPELISFKLTQGFTHKDCQKLWLMIARELNAIPGAKKTWRQWRKTWQDIKSKTKKRHERNGELPPSASMLTLAEQEAIGIKNMAPATYQDSTEFVPIQAEDSEIADGDNTIEHFAEEVGSTGSISEPESIPEDKVFTRSKKNAKSKSATLNSSHNHEQSSSCTFNCEMLSIQEQRKVQIKEDYYSFKKDYLKQKLVLLRMQTEALKSIAKELLSK